MKQTITILILLLGIFTAAEAQENPVIQSQDERELTFGSDSLRNRKKFPEFLHLRAGTMASSFYRPDLTASNGVLTNPLWGFHVGLGIDFLQSKYHYYRADLSFVQKGAREFFTENDLDIEGVTRLSYLQLTLFPVVLKAESGKFNPSIGIGGYFSQRIGASSKTSVNGDAAASDPVSLTYFDARQDAGLALSFQMMYKKRPGLEVRYEAGLKSLSSVRNIRNRAVVLSFVF